jgi:hypothetical protein
MSILASTCGVFPVYFLSIGQWFSIIAGFWHKKAKPAFSNFVWCLQKVHRSQLIRETSTCTHIFQLITCENGAETVDLGNMLQNGVVP